MVTAIADAIEAQGLPPEDQSLAAEVATAPVAELVLELTAPEIRLDEGKRRPQASARLIYHRPSSEDGAKREATEDVVSEAFSFTAPIGPIEAGELQWYLERYWQWPTGVFRDRARQVESDLPRWGQLLYQAMPADLCAAVVRAWRASGRGTQSRFTVAVRRDDTGPEAAEAATLLLGLPWELIHDGRGYLFQGARGVRVRRRFEEGETVDEPPPYTPSKPPIRVLLASPRPDDESAGYIDHRVSALPVVDALWPLGELAQWTILVPVRGLSRRGGRG